MVFNDQSACKKLAPFLGVVKLLTAVNATDIDV